MTRITKRGIDKILNDNLLKILLKEIKKCETTDKFSALLDDLFTQEEQIMVKKRLAVKAFVKKGMGTNEISRLLDVSRATISFINKGLKRAPKKEIKAGKKISQRDYTTRLKRPPLLPGYSSKDRWSFLNRPQI
jgi:uncharacterized protein YerC